jgi:hypothetical protein
MLTKSNLGDGPTTETVQGLLDSKGWDFDSSTRDPIHDIHPYPARFIPEIPRQLLTVFHPQDGLVLDVFAGSVRSRSWGSRSREGEITLASELATRRPDVRRPRSVELLSGGGSNRFPLRKTLQLQPIDQDTAASDSAGTPKAGVRPRAASPHQKRCGYHMKADQTVTRLSASDGTRWANEPHHKHYR